jgi:mannose-6-phosphate isomerase-like protein (cupin superfamily)
MVAAAAAPIVVATGAPPVAVSGTTLAVHEWTDSGPSYLHIHESDDEIWYVLEGTLTFRFRDGTREAAAGTTVFVPAGVAHTYVAHPGSRYLIFLTAKLDRLIARLRALPDMEGVPETLAEFDTVMVDERGA